MENDKQITEAPLNLREDLIIEIISRVSVEDLMRFKSISKSWCSLIHTDTYFHRLQFQRTASLDRPFLYIVQENYTPIAEDQFQFDMSVSNYLIDLESIDNQNLNLVEISDPFNKGEGEARVIGSCHGMFVLRQDTSRRMALSNPTTKKHHRVPPNPAGDDNVDFLGLGFDHVHQRYKLVTRIKDHINTLMIYDVKDGTWRERQFDDLGHYDYFYCLNYYRAIHVDGVLHYYVDLKSRTSELMKIICLDLAKEEFHVLESPEFGEVVSNPMMTVFDGRLCLSCQAVYERDKCRTEFWTMEGSSYCPRWTKFLTLPCPNFNALFGKNGDLLVPVCFSACRNRILMDIDMSRRLSWHDMQKNEFIKPDNIRTRPGCYRDTVGCCVRSLISG